MATLAKEAVRSFELGDVNEVGVKATTKIYEGAAVGIDAATGLARPLVAGDQFAGFAESTADNSAGNGGDVNVRLKDHGKVVVPIAGVAAANEGDPVYASDDDTFTLTATANSYIGRIARVPGDGTAVVAFDAYHGNAA